MITKLGMDSDRYYNSLVPNCQSVNGGNNIPVTSLTRKYFQAYEMLKNHTSALTHHLKALNLRPNNDRICEAIGDSYEKLDQLDIAKRYFKRASR